MSVVCANCGSANRASAMFCKGCAGRLPGFEPSGPSALDAMNALRPPGMTIGGTQGGGGQRRGSSVVILPAERPVFWLRLGVLLLAMGVAFVLFYVYVTRKVNGPASTPVEMSRSDATSGAPATPLAAVTPQASSTATAPTATPPTPSSTPPSATDKTASSAKTDDAANDAASAGRAATEAALALRSPSPLREQRAPAAQAAAEASASAVPQAPSAPVAAADAAAQRNAAAARRTRSRPPQQDAVAANERPSWTLPGVPAEPAMPTAPAGSPPYVTPSASSRSNDDLGPPVVVGPGPRYGLSGTSPAPTPVRAGQAAAPYAPVTARSAGPGSAPGYPVRAPLAANDPGPPVVAGPGPQYDYSTPSYRSR